MEKTIFKSLVVCFLVLHLEISGQETSSQPAPGGKRSAIAKNADKKAGKKRQQYDLIAIASATSLLDISQKSSKILEELSPGSSMLLVVGLSAMAMKPEFQNIDFNENVKFLAYSMGDSKQPVVWALVLKLKEARQPVRETKDTFKLYKREIGDYVIIAESESLVNDIREIPDFKLAGQSDLSLELYPSKFSMFYKVLLQEYRDYLVKRVMSDAKPNRDTLNYIKLIQLNIEYLELVLAQCHRINIDVSLKPDTVFMKSVLSPEKDSLFSVFLKKQPEDGKSKISLKYTKDTIVAKAHLVLTSVLESELLHFVKDIYIETAKNVNDLEFLETLEFLLRNSNGDFALFTQNQPKDYQFYVRSGFNAKQQAAISRYLQKNCVPTKQSSDKNASFQLIRNRNRIVCEIKKDQIDVYSQLPDATQNESFIKTVMGQLTKMDPDDIWLETTTILLPQRLDLNLNLNIKKMRKVFYKETAGKKKRKRVRLKF